jgi:uncharacterized membrane protein YqjE
MSMTTSEQTKMPAAGEPSMATLLNGIVNDVQRLLKQHLELFREEVRQDVQKVKRGAMAFAVALLLALVGAAFVLTALVGLLAWAVPAVPWWGWAGILGLVFAGIAFALIQAGKKSISSIGIDNTAQEIKEDIQWLKK